MWQARMSSVHTRGTRPGLGRRDGAGVRFGKIVTGKEGAVRVTGAMGPPMKVSVKGPGMKGTSIVYGQGVF